MAKQKTITVKDANILGLWEKLYNQIFNPLEFEGVRTLAGLNAFTLSPTQWVEATNAIGLISQAGRYGGMNTTNNNRWSGLLDRND